MLMQADKTPTVAMRQEIIREVNRLLDYCDANGSFGDFGLEWSAKGGKPVPGSLEIRKHERIVMQNR